MLAAGTNVVGVVCNGDESQAESSSPSLAAGRNELVYRSLRRHEYS